MTEQPIRRDAGCAHEPFMRVAIATARRGLLAGEPPIGACVVADGEVIARANNSVIGELDATAHAEMRVIREACRRQRSLSLAGCTLYVTVEPCPMCLSACHYAGIDRIVFGAALDDMHALTGSELQLGPAALARAGLAVTVIADCLRDECRALLDRWSAGGRRR
ncbi:MAG: nucleoside deaminase [Gammaproteobacteria bacterium]